MNSSRLFLYSCLGSFLFLVAACAEDDAVIIPEDDVTAISDPTEGSDNPEESGTHLANLDVNFLHDWTELLLEVERYATGMRPNASARALAYIYLAGYEAAVPGMDDHRSATDAIRGFNVNPDRANGSLHWGIAINTALARTLDHFLINVPSTADDQIDALQNSFLEAFSNDISPELLNASEEWGNYVADRVIAFAQSDVQAEAQILDPQPDSYEPPTGDGFWTYSADPERALFPYWGEVRTFVIAPEETTSVDPVEYSEQAGSDYYNQMMEVYTVNNAAMTTDDEQLWIAEFWSDDVEGLMFSPPARQFAIANQLIEQYGLSAEETLYLYLKLGVSLNDAAVATWKYKYEYMVMRPNVFIHEHIDPDFQTNLYRLVYWPNPSFPGYPSGHSCFASAAAGVFIDFFGDQTNFTDRSHEGRTEFLGAPRSFNSFRDLARENAFSRIPLGVHIRMDCAEGLRLGYEISDAINELDLRRRPA
ncbi:MAG: vanadium-dependent haloperoxidase [Bacteroidota bacterium]